MVDDSCAGKYLGVDKIKKSVVHIKNDALYFDSFHLLISFSGIFRYLTLDGSVFNMLTVKLTLLIIYLYSFYVL